MNSGLALELSPVHSSIVHTLRTQRLSAKQIKNEKVVSVLILPGEITTRNVQLSIMRATGFLAEVNTCKHLRNEDDITESSASFPRAPPCSLPSTPLATRAEWTF